MMYTLISKCDWTEKGRYFDLVLQCIEPLAWLRPGAKMWDRAADLTVPIQHKRYPTVCIWRNLRWIQLESESNGGPWERGVARILHVSQHLRIMCSEWEWSLQEIGRVLK